MIGLRDPNRSLMEEEKERQVKFTADLEEYKKKEDLYMNVLRTISINCRTKIIMTNYHYS